MCGAPSIIMNHMTNRQTEFPPLAVVQHALRRLPPASFDWGEADLDDLIGTINEDLIAELKQINSIAAVAYTLAAAEWIYFYVRGRLAPEDAQACKQHICAYWSWLAESPRRERPPCYESQQSETRSAYNDAVEIALETVTNGAASAPVHETAVDAAFITQLCEYILPRQSGFTNWRIDTLERLASLFPADATHYDRVRISRHLFDGQV
jgi:hypothetical protein